jgi:hypothetical protein
MIAVPQTCSVTLHDRTESKCPQCGWPESVPYETVSRHLTSTGMIVYTRCVCGRLQVRSYQIAGRRSGLIARGDSAARAAATGVARKPLGCGASS